MKSAGRRGMRISNRGSDMERFFSDHKMSTLQQNLRNLIKKELGYVKQLDYIRGLPMRSGQEVPVRRHGSIPRSEDALEKEMATHPSILAGKIPRTEEPGGLAVHGVAKNRIRLSALTTRTRPREPSLSQAEMLDKLKKRVCSMSFKKQGDIRIDV